jgi:hypothetical protein
VTPEPAAHDLVVDNTAGGDPVFAAEVVRLLRGRGLDVEVRSAGAGTMFDSRVHVLEAGLVIRVPRRPDRTLLRAIEEDLRAALMHRPSERRRTRSVPIHLGDTHRVIEWVDVFD